MTILTAGLHGPQGTVSSMSHQFVNGSKDACFQLDTGTLPIPLKRLERFIGYGISLAIGNPHTKTQRPLQVLEINL